MHKWVPGNNRDTAVMYIMKYGEVKAVQWHLLNKPLTWDVQITFVSGSECAYVQILIAPNNCLREHEE